MGSGTSDVVCVFVRVQSCQSMWLMQALGFLLSALPVEEILGRLHPLVTPHVQQLDALVQLEVHACSPVFGNIYMEEG